MKQILAFAWIIILFQNTHAQPGEFLIPAKENDEWGFINPEEQWIIPLKYDDAQSFSDGLAAVNYFGKWGFINSQGKWVIEPKYSEARSFSEGAACVMSYGKWGYIDKSGDWIIEPRYHAVSAFSGGLAVVYYDKGYRFIDKTGRYVFDYAFKKALPFSEGLAYAEREGYAGYIDISGSWIIRCQYDEAFSFSNGMALVGENGKYGYIDQRGDPVITPIYKDGFRFNEGMAPVKEDEKWGYIDKWGNWLILPQFDCAMPFNEGFAVAEKNGKYGMINKAGYWAIDPQFEDIREMNRTVGLREEIERMVTRKVYQWQLKGEFEKTSEYLERVSLENRKKAIEEITHQCIQDVAMRRVNLNEAELGQYNADGEFFLLTVPCVDRTLLPISLEEALWFRDNWEIVQLSNPVYSLADNQFILTRYEATMDGKSYVYSAELHGLVRGQQYNEPVFDAINIELPDVSGLEIHNQPVARVQGPSDVDRNIPGNAIVQSSVFALVIGNEDYSSYQVGTGGAINVDFAEADARTFAAYLNKTFGVPKENITLLINATVGQMKQAIDRLTLLAKVYEGEAELVFYYAGHGLPDEKTKEPYLIPVDVSGSDLTYAVRLEDIYNRFSIYETRRVTIFLDACFSGGARSQGLVAARGVRIRPKSPFVLGNLVVFSASSGDQTAYAYTEKGHGMFTYYLLKKFQDTHGMVTYGELANHLMSEVNKKSLLINNREQTPVVKLSPIFQNTWKEFSMMGDNAVSKSQ